MNIILTAFILFLIAQPSNADITVTRSKDKTSKDLPLSFALENTGYSERMKTLDIKGTVKNTTKKKFKSIKVILKATDSAGKVLGRNTFYTDPEEINAGQVGYISGMIYHVKSAPSGIEYIIIEN